MIDQDFAVYFVRDAGRIQAGYKPSRHRGVLDSVGYKLDRQVVGIAAGMVCSPEQRDVSTGCRIGRQNRRKIFVRVPWLHTYASSIFFPCEGECGQHDCQ